MKNKGYLENIKNLEKLSEKGKETLFFLLPEENHNKNLSVFIVSDDINIFSRIKQLINFRVDENFYALSVAFVTKEGESSYTLTRSRMAYDKSRIYSWIRRVARKQESEVTGLRLGLKRNEDDSCWKYLVVMNVF